MCIEILNNNIICIIIEYLDPINVCKFLVTCKYLYYIKYIKIPWNRGDPIIYKALIHLQRISVGDTNISKETYYSNLLSQSTCFNICSLLVSNRMRRIEYMCKIMSAVNPYGGDKIIIKTTFNEHSCYHRLIAGFFLGKDEHKTYNNDTASMINIVGNFYDYMGLFDGGINPFQIDSNIVENIIEKLGLFFNKNIKNVSWLLCDNVDFEKFINKYREIMFSKIIDNTKITKKVPSVKNNASWNLVSRSRVKREHKCQDHEDIMWDIENIIWPKTEEEFMKFLSEKDKNHGSEILWDVWYSILDESTKIKWKSILEIFPSSCISAQLDFGDKLRFMINIQPDYVDLALCRLSTYNELCDPMVKTLNTKEAAFILTENYIGDNSNCIKLSEWVISKLSSSFKFN